MVFPVVGGDGKPTGYEIDNSLRFNDDDGAYLQRTAGANTGEDNATLSFWFKLGNIKSDNNGGTIMTEGGTTGNHVMQIYANKIYIGSGAFGIMFPNLIRDPSAWYHLFIAFDTSQSTNTNRVKAYLNGTTKAYTDFGEFNDNGVWIPKKYTGGSYGDNGFYLEFKQTGTSANSSGMGADTSGNDNHMSVTNLAATDVTTDTPQNNFATANPLGSNASAFAEGNTKTTGDTGTSNSLGASSSMGFKSGKWYMEFKVSDVGNNTYIGLMKDGNHLSVNGDYQYPLGNLFYRHDGDKLSGSGSGFGVDTTYGDTFTDNDIIGVAADMDNRNLYFYKIKHK